VQLRGSAHGCQRGGSIIIVSSIGANQGSSTLGVYGMSKAADFALVRNLAIEWGPQGIRANGIAPGLIKTDFSRALWQNEQLLRNVEQGTPVRRIGQPEDIGASPCSSRRAQRPTSPARR